MPLSVGEPQNAVLRTSPMYLQISPIKYQQSNQHHGEDNSNTPSCKHHLLLQDTRVSVLFYHEPYFQANMKKQIGCPLTYEFPPPRTKQSTSAIHATNYWVDMYMDTAIDLHIAILTATVMCAHTLAYTQAR